MPATIHAVLTSPSTGCPAAKQLLQTACSHWEGVSLALLQALTALSEAALGHSLRHFQAAELYTKPGLP